MDEAPHHPHNAYQGSFIPSSYNPGHYEPRPAPRLSRTPGTVQEGAAPLQMGQHTTEVLSELRYGMAEIEGFLKDKIVKQASAKAHL